MAYDLLCAALARSIAVRLPLASHEELRAFDVVLQTLEAIRHGDGRDWLRRVATGPGDVDPSYHLARPLRATIVTACGGSWLIDDAVELSPNPPLVERCHACWRAAAYSSPGGPALGEALLVVVAEMAELDRELKKLREQARLELLGQPFDYIDQINGHVPGTPYPGALIRQPDGEFAPDQHLTRLDSTSAVIALAEIPRSVDRDPYGVELDWGADAEWGVDESGDVGGGAESVSR